MVVGADRDVDVLVLDEQNQVRCAGFLDRRRQNCLGRDAGEVVGQQQIALELGCIQWPLADDVLCVGIQQALATDESPSMMTSLMKPSTACNLTCPPSIV